MTEMPPSRDPKIPESAVWDSERSEFIDCPIVDGEKSGTAHWYRPDGSVCAIEEWKHNLGNGPYKRFHQNGEVSQIGCMLDDKLDGEIVWEQSTGTSTEDTIPEYAGEKVWKVLCHYIAGTPYPARFFARDGREVLYSGTDIPTRPDSIDARAVFSEEEDRWFTGLGVNGHEHRDGVWKWWTSDGALVDEKHYDKGELRSERTLEGGVLRTENSWNADGKQTTKTSFSGGVLQHRIEHEFDDETLVGFKLTFEDYVRAEGKSTPDGLHYEIFRDDGTVECTGLAREGMAVGDWQFLVDGAMQTVNLDERRVKIDIDEEFDIEYLLGIAFLHKEGQKGPSALLDGVQDIDWENTSTCYGDAQRFPLFLQAMLSDIEAVRDCAYSSIYSQTLHQGSVYPATAKVLPFMAAIIEHENVSTVQIVNYIDDVVNAAAPWVAEAHDWEEEDDDRLAILGCMESASSVFPALAKYIESDDVALRSLLLSIAGQVGEPGKALLIRVIDESDGDDKSVAVEALVSLEETSMAEAAKFLESEDGLVRLMCAIHMARRFCDECPARVVEVLAEPLSDDTLAERYHDLATTDSYVWVFIALGLGQIRTPAAFELIPDLISHLPTVGAQADDLCRGLFATCFGGGELPFAPHFMDVFQAVSECEILDGYLNFREVADMWRLPHHRPQYLKLIEKLSAAPDAAECMRELMINDEAKSVGQKDE